MLRLILDAVLLVLVEALTLTGLVMRFLPAVLSALRFLAQFLLALSCLLYRVLLIRSRRWLLPFGIDLVNTHWRLVATGVLSCALGGAMCWLFGWPITILAALIALVHGMAVGIVWDRLGLPGGLTLGV